MKMRYAAAVAAASLLPIQTSIAKPILPVFGIFVTSAATENGILKDYVLRDYPTKQGCLNAAKELGRRGKLYQGTCMDPVQPKNVRVSFGWNGRTGKIYLKSPGQQ